MVWSLQDAKNKFSEVVDRAITEGPQKVLRHGRATAVVVSTADWEAVQGRRQTLAEFFLQSPLFGAGLDLTRDKSPARPVEL